MLIDVQRDRADAGAAARNPMLRVKERNEEGGVVADWKACSTAVVFSDTMLIGNVVKPGTESEHIIFAGVPVNHPKVTHVGRRSNAAPDASAFERPISSLGDGLDTMAYFDDVLIPWENVYHLGNVDHARLYAQRAFDFEHVDTVHHMIVNAELMAGLAILIAQANGTAQHPVVGSDIADIVRFHETLRAFNIASEATAIVTHRGLCKPNNIFYDFGRAHYLENVGRLAEKIVDTCGRSAVLLPSENDFEVPGIGTKLRELFHGTTLSSQDKGLDALAAEGVTIVRAPSAEDMSLDNSLVEVIEYAAGRRFLIRVCTAATPDRLLHAVEFAEDLLDSPDQLGPCALHAGLAPGD